MNVEEQIKIFQEFIERNYYPQLLEAVRKGQSYLVLDFSELIKFNTELAEEILESPEDLLKAAELAVKEFDLPKKVVKFNVRLTNLPESQKIQVNEIRSKHLNKFIWSEGIVRQKTDVRPHVTAAKFECPSCGNILNVLQLDKKYKEPSRCGCGRKGKFKEISKELIDGQGLVLEEAPDELDGSQPKRINVFLKSDLVTPMHERKSSPGSRVRLCGWVTEVPMTLKTGGQATKYDLIIEANNIEPSEEDNIASQITDEELEEIKEISRSERVINVLSNSLAPSIYGHDKIKEALVLQLAGGCRKIRPDGVTTRGDIHMLLIGDPGAAKCVVGDTKIPLEDGSILPIKKIIKEKISLAINTINYKGKCVLQNPSKRWKRKSPKKLLQITSGTGKKIIITKNHPFFITKNGLITPIAAEDLKKGDFVASARKINYIGKLQNLPTKFNRSKSKNQQPLIFPKKVTKDFAKFLGYVIGDGYLSLSRTSGWVSFTNNNKALIDDFAELMKKLFNGKTTSRQRNNCYEQYINSRSIINFLSVIEEGIVAKSADKKIPQIINRSPLEVLKSFISALFECEAHINIKRQQVEFSSISKDLIEDLQTNLLKFGIISIIQDKVAIATNTIKKRKIPAWKIIISGEQVEYFDNKIKFISKEKRQAMRELIKTRAAKKSNTNIDVIPNLKDTLKELRNKLNFYQKEMGLPRGTYLHYELGDRNPSRKNLQKMLINMKERVLGDDIINLLNKLVDADIFWDKIKDIKEVSARGKEVFDLQIDQNHNFIAGDFIIHNSQLLKRIAKIAPKARFTSGKGATAAGLTASVVKDEFLGGWSLEAGTLVLANRGFAVIDEMDKMGKEDRSALHEAMEQQQVSISKANIQANLRCETTIIAAANPKFGRFDPYDLIANQINLPPTLINRFDLIFPIKDMPNRERDSKMATFILNLHKSPEEAVSDIPDKLFKKYFTYIRQEINPVITEEAIEELKDYYITMRNSGSADEGGIKSIPITARQLEALVRLAEAAAKIRLSKTVSKEDAQKAIELVNHCLNEIAKDSETGKIDIDRLTSGITATQRSGISTIKEIIGSLEEQMGSKIIPVENITNAAQEKNIPKNQAEEILEKLRRSGDIFEPKRGFIQKL